VPCKLPSDLIRPPKRRLGDIGIGETVYVLAYTMQLDAEGFCYLDPDSTLCACFSQTIRVTRAEDGFHVSILRKCLAWETGSEGIHGWLPVESVTEDLQPDLG
jgi:hypothetical protein